MNTVISLVVFTFRLSANRLSLGRFQLNGQNHQISVNVNVPMQIIHFFERWLNYVSRAAVNQDVTGVLCRIFAQIFRIISPPNNYNGDLCENLAVMVIDGSVRLGDNLVAVSNEFNIRGITLAVVAAAPFSYEEWNYYRTLAHLTGGEYMLLANARIILAIVILSVINGENTLCQGFRNIRVCLLVHRTDEHNEQNQTTDGVGDLPFDHGLSE